MGETISTATQWYSGKPDDDQIQQKIYAFLRKHPDKDVQKCASDIKEYWRKMYQEIKTLKEEKQDIIYENSTLRTQLKSSEHGKVLINCLDEQERMAAENRKLKEETKRLSDHNKRLITENEVLATEKENALSRLSKIAGIQMSKGNAAIADLSDPNRPTQLGEKWSSLYTDEWSEAYDEITMNKTIKRDNCQAERELFQIATQCYEICKEIEKKQMTEIKKHAWDIACCLLQQPDQRADKRQTSFYHKLNTKEDETKSATIVPGRGKNDPNLASFGENIQAIQRTMEELLQIVHERRKYDKNLKEYVIKEVAKRFDKLNKPNSKGSTLKYIRSCSNLCWSMVIKDPPMALVYEGIEGKPIDKNLFSPYTARGSTVVFVVWPALLLHKDGPVLAKGSVQGKEENQLKGTETSTENRQVQSTHAGRDQQHVNDATFIVKDQSNKLEDKYFPPQETKAMDNQSTQEGQIASKSCVVGQSKTTNHTHQNPLSGSCMPKINTDGKGATPDQM